MLPIFDRVRVRVTVRFSVQRNSVMFKISLSATSLTASWFVGELSSKRTGIQSTRHWQ